MNALKGRVSNDLDDLVNRTDSPFTAPVNSFPLPSKFRMPQIDSYDGVRDPLDHLETFKTLMHLQGVADVIMCMTTIIIHRFFVDVQIHNIFHKLIQFHLYKFYAQKKKKIISSSKICKVSISKYIPCKFL